MRHHKGLGVGHIYTHLKPDNSILLSDDATTTHPTHHLEASDNPPVGNHRPHPHEQHPSLNNTTSLGNTPTVYVVVDTSPLLVGSDSDDGHEDKDDDDECSPDEDESSDDDDNDDDDGDVDIDDMHDPLDLDYEDYED